MLQIDYVALTHSLRGRLLSVEEARAQSKDIGSLMYWRPLNSDSCILVNSDLSEKAERSVDPHGNQS